MTLEELRELIAERMKRDPRLRAILKRIEAGKATAQDSFTYSRIAAEIMADELSGAVLSLDDREAVCAALLRDRYDDTVTQADAIQRVLDAKNGLHIQPRKPAFPAERVQQIAHSLVQPDVPDEKIVRRAGSTATVAMSFHDDFVKENAKFRAKAGLKCYITRVTDGKCCPWCSDVAGRYAYGSEPRDIFKRHDNCGCTVTYENGRQRQDVWSKRTWEAPAAGAGAKEPARLTPEQAAEIEAKHQPTVLTGGKKPAIIRIEDIQIGRSVGAKAKNYDIMDLSTGEIFHLVEGSRLQDVQVFAGKGTRTEFRDAEKYAERYGGSPDDWQHAKGIGMVDFYGEGIMAELHWVQCDGIGRFEFFVKRWFE